MAIVVVCPGCRKRFRVSDKFAGRIGPCPNCKQLLEVPDKTKEIKIHAPQEFEQGGRSTNGQLPTQPIAWEETKFNPAVAATIAGAALLIFAAAFALGKLGLFTDNYLFTAVGLTLISPLLSLAAYSFLYSDDLEPYKGASLYIRATICGFIYVTLWGVYAYVQDVAITGEVWNWVFVAPPFFVLGSITAVATLDLEYGNAFFHYSFYLLVTIILRWAAGMNWIWDAKP
ncbi:MAG TPA: hypothetical protein VIH42_09610 [Thermoguttaceae bacterium]